MIPLPPARAVYTILRSCLLELMRVRLVVDAPVPDWSTLAFEPSEAGVKLRELAVRCHVCLPPSRAGADADRPSGCLVAHCADCPSSPTRGISARAPASARASRSTAGSRRWRRRSRRRPSSCSTSPSTLSDRLHAHAHAHLYTTILAHAHSRSHNASHLHRLVLVLEVARVTQLLFRPVVGGRGRTGAEAVRHLQRRTRRADRS